MSLTLGRKDGAEIAWNIWCFCAKVTECQSQTWLAPWRPVSKCSKNLAWMFQPQRASCKFCFWTPWTWAWLWIREQTGPFLLVACLASTSWSLPSFVLYAWWLDSCGSPQSLALSCNNVCRRWKSTAILQKYSRFYVPQVAVYMLLNMKVVNPWFQLQTQQFRVKVMMSHRKEKTTVNDSYPTWQKFLTMNIGGLFIMTDQNLMRVQGSTEVCQTRIWEQSWETPMTSWMPGSEDFKVSWNEPLWWMIRWRRTQSKHRLTRPRTCRTVFESWSYLLGMVCFAYEFGLLWVLNESETHESRWPLCFVAFPWMLPTAKICSCNWMP